jgi:Sap, sulfolipid-1-addressing protein
MSTQALALALAGSIYPPAVAAVIALGRGTDVRPRVFAFVAASLLVTYVVGAAVLYVLVEVGATGSHHLTPGAAVDIALGVLLMALAWWLRRRGPRRSADVAARLATASAAPATTSASPPTTSAAPATTSASRAPASAAPAPASASLPPASAAPATATAPSAAGGGSLAAADDRAESAGAQAKPSKIERYLHSRRLAFVLGFVLYALPSPIYVGAVKSIADASSSTAAELGSLAVVVGVMLWMIELPMVMLLAFPERSAGVLEAINRWFAEHGRALAIIAAVGAGAYLIVKGMVQLD